MAVRELDEAGILAVAEDLLGTCQNLDDVLAEEFGVGILDIPVTLLSLLDSQVLCCDTCGWWVESSDVDEDGTCTECRE